MQPNAGGMMRFGYIGAETRLENRPGPQDKAE